MVAVLSTNIDVGQTENILKLLRPGFNSYYGLHNYISRQLDNKMVILLSKPRCGFSTFVLKRSIYASTKVEKDNLVKSSIT